MQQWNIGIQHELKGTVLSARYIGNKGSGLLRAIDYNQVLYNANGFLADFQRAQNNAGLAEKAGLGYVGTYNANVAGSVPLTVFPLLTGGGNLTNATYQTLPAAGPDRRTGQPVHGEQAKRPGELLRRTPTSRAPTCVTNGGASNYHALQLEVTRRTRCGLQGQFSYTYGKSLSNTAGDLATGLEPLLDNNNPNLEWARSPYDLRHVFKANYYYELPYGKGKHWSGNALMNGVLGNWAVSGIWSYQAGSPYSVLSTYGTLNRAGAIECHQYRLRQRHDAGSTGAADGRRVHDGQRSLLRVALDHRQRWPRRGAGRQPLPSPASCSSTRQRATSVTCSAACSPVRGSGRWDMSVKKSFADQGASLAWMSAPT